MTSERDFELAEIYDDTDAMVYRLGDEAVTIFANRGACVVRPWHWLPNDGRAYPEAPEQVVSGIKLMETATEEWSGTVGLGELVIWSSRRNRRDDWMPPEDDDTPMFVVARSLIDAQRVGNRVFNRRLIREATQAFVENWEEGDSASKVRCSIKTLPNGAALCLSLNQIRAFVMCLSDSVSAGDERMPNHKCECQWEAGDSPCPVHGIEEDEPAILKAGTSPIPFIQVGMVVRSTTRSVWKVVGIDEIPADLTMIRLRSSEGVTIERPSSLVRRWELVEAFDSNTVSEDEPLSFSAE